MRSNHPSSLPFLFAAVLATGTGGAAADEISFNRDIRPILSEKCFACHGPDEGARKADLRLDMREEALAEEAFLPGDAEGSELHRRIHADEADERMPPREENEPLSAEEKRKLTRWIDEGAEYQAHWSYIPVERPAVSAEGSAAIDHFVDRRLAEEGLERSPPADDPTLLRRLHFDLTGLPPEPGDLATFRRIGLEAYVDRLLDSPYYGERMALDWLDAVRYADSYGYHGDQFVEVSAFRDWVIRSFNENVPYDRFTIEQIAGDLLEEATLSQRVAAAYNRLGPSSNEGGIQDAEYLAKYRAERVRTTATAWLGSTLACAECHDHKFDPFTTRDFYEFGAYFADILEKGAWNDDGSYQEDPSTYEGDEITLTKRGPVLDVPTEKQRARLETLRTDLAEARDRLFAETPALRKGAAKWAQRMRRAMAAGEPRDYIYLTDRGQKNGVKTKGWTFVAAKDGPVHHGGVSRRQAGEGTVQHIGKAGKNPVVISGGDVLFTWVRLDPERPPRQLMLQFHREEEGWRHRAWWGEDRIPFGRGAKDGAHHRMGDLPAAGEWIRLEVPASALGLEPGDEITQLAFTQHGGVAHWDEFGLRTAADRYRLADVPEKARHALERAAEQRTAAGTAAILAHYRTLAPELAPARREVAGLEDEIAAVEEEVRTVPATLSAVRREVRVLPRGNWRDDSGDVVSPSPPDFLPGGGDSGEREGTRLDLAKWIASPENPLTARTFANRLWARFFGTGISKVLDDLGSQGEWPTHPELLDWLAAEFVESGWDVKHLVRTIVLSETYRQSSDSTAALQEKDPYNRLLARQSAIRLPAELVRDNALAVSGLLEPEVGGRSVRPYQPEGYYRHLNFPRRTYEEDRNEDQYRRGLYTHWQRTFLHPAMKAFDAPAREECTMERVTSSTPLQALVLLNDPSFVEAARALAADSEDILDMFVETLARRPRPRELAVLEDLYRSEKKRLASEPGAADGLLGVGMKKVEATDRVDLAARTAVARTLLNLHETITRY